MTPDRRPDGQPPSRLQRLDRRLVPVLQRVARGTGRALGAPLRWLARWEDRVASGRLVETIYPNRGLLLLVIVALAFVGSAVHLQRYPELRDAERQAAGPGEDVTRPGAETEPAHPTPPGPGRVGPPIGVDLDRYVADRHAALGAATDDGEPRVAVVSFTEYRTAAEARDLLPAGATALVVQYRLPTEDARPGTADVTDGDLEGAVERVVSDAREEYADEEEEVRRLLESGTVEEEDFRRDLEARLSELQAARNVLGTGAGIVFAVVVRAPLAVLQALPERDGVRLVDPAPPGTDVEGSVFYGVPPEDRDRAVHGRRG